MLITRGVSQRIKQNASRLNACDLELIGIADVSNVGKDVRAPASLEEILLWQQHQLAQIEASYDEEKERLQARFEEDASFSPEDQALSMFLLATIFGGATAVTAAAGAAGLVAAALVPPLLVLAVLGTCAVAVFTPQMNPTRAKSRAKRRLEEGLERAVQVRLAALRACQTEARGMADQLARAREERLRLGRGGDSPVAQLPPPSSSP